MNSHRNETRSAFPGIHGRRTLASRVALVTVDLAAAVSLALVAVSCSKEQAKKPVLTLTNAPIDTFATSTPGPTQAVPAMMGPNVAPDSRLASLQTESTSIDSLPPELTASGPDTLVVPGAVIEITAVGTPDVTEMVLADRLGRKQRLVYDQEQRVWHTYYRVPMKLPTDRVELSVTAKNGHLRWCRVWVFVDLDRGEGANGC